MVQTVRVDVPSYGTVTGTCRGAVECFLGIPYASVSKRWTKPVQARPFPGLEHDGTQHGPRCPQLKLPVSITQLAVPGYPANPHIAEDEFTCLNLNITRPRDIHVKLPVMVWIHGGGFSVGSNSELVYDGIEFVTRSKIIDKPVIHVAINYRLGFFGFLASEELLEEAHGKSVGNYGIWDQSAALEFLCKTIGAFGGDADRITLFGESAGAASVHSHLLHGNALFDRAICQSGVTNTLGPLPLKSPFHQGLYNALQRQLSCKSLKELRLIPAAELILAMPSLYSDLPVLFLVDDSGMTDGFYPSGIQWNLTPSFCKALLLGSCTNEGIIIGKALASIKSERLEYCLKQSNMSMDTLRSYGLDTIGTADIRSNVPALVEFASDLLFKGPLESVKAKAPADSLFVYRFERENKWLAGPFKGEAHHTIDLLYLAGVPQKFATEDPATDREISEKMIDAWLEFGNGGQPWRPYSHNQAELVIGHDGSFSMATESVSSRKISFNQMKREIARDPVAVLHLNAVLSNGAIRS